MINRTLASPSPRRAINDAECLDRGFNRMVAQPASGPRHPLPGSLSFNLFSDWLRDVLDPRVGTP